MKRAGMKTKEEMLMVFDAARESDPDVDTGHFELRGYSIYSMTLAIFSSTRKQKMSAKEERSTMREGESQNRKKKYQPFAIHFYQEEVYYQDGMRTGPC